MATILSLSATGWGAVTVGDVVSQVSPGSYQGYLDNLLFAHTGQSRYSASDQHDLARDSVSSALAGFGLTTTVDPFTDASGRASWNVVGELRGATRPNDIFIIGAHYDTAFENEVHTPGADDNASGVAGVLEAARALAGYRFGATIRFIAFDREEEDPNGQFLQGSAFYANAHSGEHILSMLSLDMIANNNAGNTAAFYSGDAALKAAMNAAVADYGQGLRLTLGAADPNSDQASFAARGFASGLFIEDGANTRYHQPNDAVGLADGYVDYAYAANMTRSVVGYLAVNAELQGVVPEPAACTAVMAAVLLAVGVWRRSRRA